MRFLLASLLCATSLHCLAETPPPLPKGFISQMLEPTDAKLVRPKAWFFNKIKTSSGHIWTISAEEATKTPYETGLRVQLLEGVEKGTKTAVDVFAQGFLDRKKAGAKVVRECKATDQNAFKRTCLETEEKIDKPDGSRKELHVLYTVYWSKALDKVIISSFSSPADKWDAVKTTASTLSALDLSGDDFKAEPAASAQPTSTSTSTSTSN